jgi:hypothetical protein
VQFFLALTTGTVYVDSKLSILRKRTIGRGFEEEITLINHDNAPVDLEIRLEADADFADLFEVKDQLAKKGERYRRVEGDGLVFGYKREKFWRETRIRASAAAELDESGFVFRAQVPPHGQWSTSLDIACLALPLQQRERTGSGNGAAATHTRDLEHGVEEWIARAPHLGSARERLSA